MKNKLAQVGVNVYDEIIRNQQLKKNECVLFVISLFTAKSKHKVKIL